MLRGWGPKSSLTGLLESSCEIFFLANFHHRWGICVLCLGTRVDFGPFFLGWMASSGLIFDLLAVGNPSLVKEIGVFD